MDRCDKYTKVYTVLCAVDFSTIDPSVVVSLFLA